MTLPRSDAFVFFGATGDLAYKKIFPALQALIRQGAVSVAGKPVLEAKRKLTAGERIEILVPAPEPAEPQGEDIPLDILYEDDELIAEEAQQPDTEHRRDHDVVAIK